MHTGISSGVPGIFCFQCTSLALTAASAERGRQKSRLLTELRKSHVAANLRKGYAFCLKFSVCFHHDLVNSLQVTS